MKTPATLSDLAQDGENPRKISGKAASGLSASLDEFGDLSGITFNIQTGQLVCGHQRVGDLKRKHGDLSIVDANPRPYIETPAGEQFTIRIVDWTIGKQRAANVAANSTAISGEFTDGLDDYLDSVRDGADIDDSLFDALLLDDLRTKASPPAASSPAAVEKTVTCPACGEDISV